jgi:hypothetical protein
MPRVSAAFRYAGDMDEEIAPPFENWEDHLKALNDRDLSDLAKDYRWLDEEARPQEERAEFRARRLAIIGECQRRGMSDAVRDCRPVTRTSGG